MILKGLPIYLSLLNRLVVFPNFSQFRDFPERVYDDLKPYHCDQTKEPSKED